jgi:hypothetical protein
MFTAKNPPAEPSPDRRAAPRRNKTVARLLLAGAALGIVAVAGCQSHSKPLAPPAGSITDDRSIGDIMVRFTPPEVTTSLEAGRLLEAATGPIRFVVKRPLSGGVWLVTAISPSPDADMAQAVATLRTVPRIDLAEPDDLRAPSRPFPIGRDMPPN